MRKSLVTITAVFFSFAATISNSAQTPAPAETLRSPNDQVAITFALDAAAAPTYGVTLRDQTIIMPSMLALDLKQGGTLSRGMKVIGTTRRSHDETYTLVAGKTKQARDHYNEMTVSLEEQAAPNRKLDLIFRAYDEGAAFRYVVPQQTALTNLEITGEGTEYRFPTDLPCWALQLGGFKTSYEAEFDRLTLSRVTAKAIVGLPLVVRMRDGVTVALSEADLKDYAGMYFTGGTMSEKDGFTIRTLLSPLPDKSGVAVRGRAGAEGARSPWRVLMIGDTSANLIGSTLITNLNPGSAIGDASWVRPGRTAWDWWSDQVVDANADFKKGMNNETMQHYIDFAGEMGLEYMLVDAGWYSPRPFGEDTDFTAKITKSIPEIDLPMLIDYARKKDVGIWVWAHWRLVNEQMDEAFPLYERLGIKGVKIDFMDRDDQEMVAFYHRVLKKAADHKLMVDLHGAYKPTGLVRTYPNYLTQEGVMGAEYNKWSARITPTHNLTLPFTRMLLGPMDYTPGGFRNRNERTFNVRFTSPEVMSTRAQQLAMFVVYESPFACVSDNPGAYRGQPGAEFLKVVPATWDETRVLSGEIGEYVVIARRRGREWFVGAMTNEQPRTIEVGLNFLEAGDYDVISHADNSRTAIDPTQMTTSKRKSRAGEAITLKLASAGGAAMHITRQAGGE